METIETIVYIRDWEEFNYDGKSMSTPTSTPTPKKYRYCFTLGDDIVICFNLMGGKTNELGDGIYIDLKRGVSGPIVKLDIEIRGTSNYTIAIFDDKFMLPRFGYNNLPSDAHSMKYTIGTKIIGGIGPDGGEMCDRVLIVYHWGNLKSDFLALNDSSYVTTQVLTDEVTNSVCFVNKTESHVRVTSRSSLSGSLFPRALMNSRWEAKIDKTYLMTMTTISSVDGRFSLVGVTDEGQLTINRRAATDVIFRKKVYYFYNLNISNNYYFTDFTGIIWKYDSIKELWTKIYTQCISAEDTNGAIQFFDLHDNGELFLFKLNEISRLIVKPLFEVCEEHRSVLSGRRNDEIPLLKQLRENPSCHNISILCEGNNTIKTNKEVLLASDTAYFNALTDFKKLNENEEAIDFKDYSTAVINGLLDYLFYDNLIKDYSSLGYINIFRLSHLIMLDTLKTICLLGLEKILKESDETFQVQKFKYIKDEVGIPEILEVWINQYLKSTHATADTTSIFMGQIFTSVE